LQYPWGLPDCSAAILHGNEGTAYLTEVIRGCVVCEIGWRLLTLRRVSNTRKLKEEILPTAKNKLAGRE